MKLRFPPLCGGAVSGLNDAGIETFEGDSAKNIVRECAQNSLDAAASTERPVKITLSRISFSRDDLPFIPELEKVITSCKDYWSHNDKAKKFFQNALNVVGSPRIDTLRISDDETSGVEGGDEDTKGQWFGLVKSRGVSNKRDADSGGAFGIGKDAPLAASALRTVLYSTRTEGDNVAFQGVCRLVTHENDEGKRTQGTGFIGNYDEYEPSFLALRDPESIPKAFRRESQGLSMWILGSRNFETKWEKPYIRSALADFWPAIYDGKLIFQIGEEVIDRKNLGKHMEKEKSHKEVSAAYPYYQSLVDQNAKRFYAKLPTAGACRLHLLLARRDLPKKICMVRRTGMVIEYYPPKIGFLPFSGLFVCDDREGNRLLKSIEPPRHDGWIASRAEDPKASQALKEIKHWIQEELRKQIPHFGDDQFNETDVPPDLLEEDQDNPATEDEANDPETDLGGSPGEASVPIKGVPKRQKILVKPAKGSEGVGDEDDETESPKGGDGKRTGGRKGKSGSGSGDSDGKNTTPFLSSRSFSNSETDDTYDLVLRVDMDYTGPVWIDAVGEDGGTESISLAFAEAVGSGPVSVESNKIGILTLQASKASRIRIGLKKPGKFSIRASLS